MKYKILTHKHVGVYDPIKQITSYANIIRHDNVDLYMSAQVIGIYWENEEHVVTHSLYIPWTNIHYIAVEH